MESYPKISLSMREHPMSKMKNKAQITKMVMANPVRKLKWTIRISTICEQMDNIVLSVLIMPIFE